MPVQLIYLQIAYPLLGAVLGQMPTKFENAFVCSNKLREISIVWVELGNISLKRKLEPLIRPTITASFQEKCVILFPDRVSHIAMVSLVAITQSKDKDNPMGVIWWARCLLSKNVAKT